MANVPKNLDRFTNKVLSFILVKWSSFYVSFAVHVVLDIGVAHDAHRHERQVSQGTRTHETTQTTGTIR